MKREPLSGPLLGILCKLGAVMGFITMSIILKITAPLVPTGEQVFFRSLFAIPVTLTWLAMRGDLRTGLRVASPMGHIWRGIAGTTAMGMGFAALGILPLPEATAISFATPLLMVVFAAMFLGEEVRAFRFSAVVIGLIGVLIILSPRLNGLGDARQTLGASLALTGAVFAALAQIFIRKLTATETTSAIVFWFSFTAAILSLVTAPFGWVMPSAGTAALLICAGIIGGISQILLTSAFRFADASIIAPFEYSAMLMALLVGYVMFDETPTPVMLSGAALVMVAGGIIIWRERALGIERAKTRKAGAPTV
ncbi:DMT family transporter [Albirhodobacter sp. R86504]|jgi:drug/metabolite transporter (DMT)-like permease|uniref:DMT family transporter n=1 Tax=Albirhodobacter sp. R86504 TaxID=3093848 RepID=UPI00366DAD0D